MRRVAVALADRATLRAPGLPVLVVKCVLVLYAVEVKVPAEGDVFVQMSVGEGDQDLESRRAVKLPPFCYKGALFADVGERAGLDG